jgi:hypothetical protein
MLKNEKILKNLKIQLLEVVINILLKERSITLRGFLFNQAMQLKKEKIFPSLFSSH